MLEGMVEMKKVMMVGIVVLDCQDRRLKYDIGIGLYR